MTKQKSYLHFVHDHLDFMKKSCKGMQADVRDRLLSCDSSSLSEGKDVSGWRLIWLILWWCLSLDSARSCLSVCLCPLYLLCNFYQRSKGWKRVFTCLNLETVGIKEDGRDWKDSILMCPQGVNRHKQHKDLTDKKTTEKKTRWITGDDDEEEEEEAGDIELGFCFCSFYIQSKHKREIDLPFL